MVTNTLNSDNETNANKNDTDTETIPNMRATIDLDWCIQRRSTLIWLTYEKLVLDKEHQVDFSWEHLVSTKIWRLFATLGTRKPAVVISPLSLSIELQDLFSFSFEAMREPV